MSETKSATHANLGREFESILERTHEVYASLNIALITKHPVEWKYTSDAALRKLWTYRQDLVARTNTGRAIARVRSYIDFSGVADGRYVTFDAKQVSRFNFPLGDLPLHQLQTVVSSAECGALSGLMIRFTAYDRMFFVPAFYLKAVYVAMESNAGKKSISLDDCKAHGVEICATNRVECDWFAALFPGGTR